MIAAAAVVIVALVLSVLETSAWLTIGCCCCSAVVLVVLVLLLTEASAWLVKESVVDQPGGRR